MGRRSSKDIKTRNTVKARFDGLPDHIRAIVWMLAASLLVTAMGALIKFLGQSMPVSQLATVRSSFLIFAILPFMLRQGRIVFHPGNPGLLVARAATLVFVNVVGFWALTRLPLVFVTSISFSKPLFIALLAAAFLGETLQMRRSVATAIGFVGVLVMLNPTGVTLSDGEWPAALGALGVAFGMAVGVILVKKLSKSEDPNTIIFYSNMGVVGVLAVPAALHWVQPDPVQWLCLAALGLIGLGSQSCFIRAFLAADAAFIAPFEYSRILAAAIVGYTLFAETPDIWTGMGAALIVGATLYMTRLEARQNKAKMARPKTTEANTKLPPPPAL